MARLEDLLTKYSVKVNEGSGCFFQPNDANYTYVLTAKHCITDDKENILTKKDISVYTNSGTKIEVKGVYPHKTKDAAILKVDLVPGIDLDYTSCANSETLIIFGYPQSRRGQPLESDKIDCEVNYKKDYFIEIKSNDLLFTSEFTVAENTVGLSGCGVFKKSNNSLLLIGIVYRLAEGRGVGGKILLQPMDNFMEIIEENNLKPLIAFHLATFRSYKDKLWRQYSTILPYLKIQLEDAVDGIINKNVSPILIKNHFQEKLCVPHENGWLNDSELWAGWLEFLTYCKLIKEETQSEGLTFALEIIDNKCLFYNNEQKDWTNLIRKIFDLDLRGLKPGACIAINSNCYPPPPKTKLNSKLIRKLIDRDPISQSRILVDQGVNPITDFTFVHLLEFNERIGKNNTLYDLEFGDETTIINELKNTIKKVFENEERRE